MGVGADLAGVHGFELGHYACGHVIFDRYFAKGTERERERERLMGG